MKEEDEVKTPATLELAAPEPVATAAPTTVMAKDHPDYAKIFKLLSLGVPMPQLVKKLEAAGLDVSVLEEPEKMVPVKGGSGDGVAEETRAAPPKKRPPPPPGRKGGK